MTLRVQAVSPNSESRPLPRDNKKLGLFKRLVHGGISFNRHHRSSNYNYNRNHHQHNANVQRNVATSVTSSSSNSTLNIISDASLGSAKNQNCIAHSHRYHNDIKKSSNEDSVEQMEIYRETHHVSFPSAQTSSSGPLNIMQWMQEGCPKDVVPLILAYAGPQKIAAIGRVNRFWYQVIDQEATWRRLCESLYKWKDGDEIPNSWKKYYQYNPCVPIDYSNIHSALNKVTEIAKKDYSKPRAIRVLLRPGRHVLREAISMDENNTIYETYSGDIKSLPIAIETMEFSPELDHNMAYQDLQPRLPSDQSKRKLRKTIRNIFQCRNVDVESEDEDFVDHDSLTEYLDHPSLSSDGRSETAPDGIEEDSGTSRDHYSRRIRKNDVVVNNRAILVLTTRRHNEPLLRVRQGCLTIRNVDLRHGSFGNDIWNGNSAIQIQPTLGPSDDPIDLPVPMVTLDRVDVTSSSGRGVVNIDGGYVKISRSYIHDCAATGIYVGGSGSRATIEQSDVIYNGKGNTRNRRGIAAGHSGIYLEQGRASILDCNISRNTLTGISAISASNALLSLQESDLVSNGTFQLEMPDVGTTAYRNSVTLNNNLASSGRGRSRSGFVV